MFKGGKPNRTSPAPKEGLRPHLPTRALNTGRETDSTRAGKDPRVGLLVRLQIRLQTRLLRVPKRTNSAKGTRSASDPQRTISQL